MKSGNSVTKGRICENSRSCFLHRQTNWSFKIAKDQRYYFGRKRYFSIFIKGSAGNRTEDLMVRKLALLWLNYSALISVYFNSIILCTQQSSLNWNPWSPVSSVVKFDKSYLFHYQSKSNRVVTVQFVEHSIRRTRINLASKVRRNGMNWFRPIKFEHSKLR